MLRVDGQAYLFAALLLLLLPFNWLLAAVFAALFHELCHILVLLILRGKIRSIHIQWNGCVIETDRIGQMQQFLSILAGPLGSFSLLLLGRIMPKAAVCGFVQGIYNLLPLMPLDGGRLLREILYQVCPGRAESFAQGTEVILRIGITAGIVLLTFSQSWNPIPGLLLAIWNIRSALRKIPCKPSQIGVQ